MHVLPEHLTYNGVLCMLGARRPGVMEKHEKRSGYILYCAALNSGAARYKPKIHDFDLLRNLRQQVVEQAVYMTTCNCGFVVGFRFVVHLSYSLLYSTLYDRSTTNRINGARH